MLFARARQLIRLARTVPVLKRCLHEGNPDLPAIITTPGEIAYRTPIHAEPYEYKMAEVMGAFMWFWIMYHVFTEPEHFTNEWPYPDLKSFTNEELGIPHDEDEQPVYYK